MTMYFIYRQTDVFYNGSFPCKFEVSHGFTLEIFLGTNKTENITHQSLRDTAKAAFAGKFMT